MVTGELAHQRLGTRRGQFVGAQRAVLQVGGQAPPGSDAELGEQAGHRSAHDSQPRPLFADVVEECRSEDHLSLDAHRRQPPESIEGVSLVGNRL